MRLLIIYLAAVSVLSAAVTVYDKTAAVAGRRRVSERSLFFLAVSGGSAAMYITMLTVRHKTLHMRFMIGLPLILAIQISIILLIALR